MHTQEFLADTAAAFARGPVLLVENDETDTFLFHRALRQAAGPAVPCHAVSNVVEAITWLNELVWNTCPRVLPRLVVCDLRLHGGTSFELVEWMNRREEFRNVPVVLWAGTMTPHDGIRAAELGISKTLVKSADTKLLTEWLRTLLLKNPPAGGGLAPPLSAAHLPKAISR